MPSEIHVYLVKVASIIQSAEEGFCRTEKLLHQLGKGGPLGETPPSKGPLSRMALIQKRKVISAAPCPFNWLCSTSMALLRFNSGLS